MEGSGFCGFDSIGAVFKKRRSSSLQKPQSDSWVLRSYIDCPSSSKLPSDSLTMSSPNGKKLFPNNNPSLKWDGKGGQVSRDFDGVSVNNGYSVQGPNGTNLKPSSEGVLALPAPARYIRNSNKVKVKFKMKSRHRGVNLENSGDHRAHALDAPNVSVENRLSKVKLKLGGVTHTVHATSDVKSGNVSSTTRTMQPSCAPRHRQKHTCQNYAHDNQSLQERHVFRGNPRKDIDGSNFFSEAKENSLGQVSEESVDVLSGHVQDSKRTPKRRVIDSTLDNHENDYQVCPERLGSSKLATNYMQGSVDDKDGSTKRNTAYIVDNEYGLPTQSTNEIKKKSEYGRECNDTYYAEKEEKYGYLPKESKRKKQKNISADSINGSRVELPSRKQKENLFTEQQQAKKAEAAQICNMQSDNADREPEAGVMRKIFRVDSDRKKSEKQRVGDRKKSEKQRVGAEKAKDDNSQSISSCTVTLLMGPCGTIVTFPEGVGLPSIFVSRSCSYHPPQEICGGPYCATSYKYRDSGSDMPLCSRRCRDVNGSASPTTTC